MVRSVIFVSDWVVMAWSGKSCLGPGEISPNVFLVQFRDGGRRMSPIFHLFVADAKEGNREYGVFKIKGRNEYGIQRQNCVARLQGSEMSVVKTRKTKIY